MNDGTNQNLSAAQFGGSNNASMSLGGQSGQNGGGATFTSNSLSTSNESGGVASSPGASGSSS